MSTSAGDAADTSSDDGRTVHVYGAPRETESPRMRDVVLIRTFDPERADALVREQKEKLAREEKRRASDEQLEKLDALIVKNVDLNIKENAKKHNTATYHCVNVKDAVPVLRRGAAFQLTLTFNRKFLRTKDDLHFIFEASTQESPAKNLRVTFTMDEDRWQRYDPAKDEDWMARMVGREKDDQKLRVEVYIPGNCVVGEWEMKVKTTFVNGKEDFVYIYPKPVAILFNPWSPADMVHFTDAKELLKEYILNESGTVFVGTSTDMGSFTWTYGQFEEGILQASFSLLRKSFNFKMKPAMADPVQVSRALSRVVNSLDDQGVLIGNWTGNFEDGVSPEKWKTSTAILRQYMETGEPVKYGQCWVFSHVLTAVCRALGLPCRSVTNFDSAHDTDNTCTVDKFFDEDGNQLPFFSSDSIWNFHVWNEVWLLRPDLPKGYDGWHCIDATPQEQSLGVFQCGPCPLEAVKKGEVHIGYDTTFVFSEVNAEIVNWVVRPGDDDVTRYSSIDSIRVGSKLSTKVPDGKPTLNIDHLGLFSRDNPKVRLDVTNLYKYPEGSPEEREVVKRAVRFTRHGHLLFKETAELEVTLLMDKETMVGKDLVVEAKVKNISKEDKRFTMQMTSRVTRYWDHSRHDDNLAREKFMITSLRPGQEETFKLTTAADVYLNKKMDISPSTQFHVYACARVMGSNMPYSTQRPFRLHLPGVEVEGPEKAKSGETVTVTASFTNPLSQTALTSVTFKMSGGLKLADEDPRFKPSYGSYTAKVDDVKPGAKCSVTVKLKGHTDNEDGQSKSMAMAFDCEQLSYITGNYTLDIEYVQPPEPAATEGEGSTST